LSALYHGRSDRVRKAIAVTSGAAHHACLPGTARAQHLAAR